MVSAASFVGMLPLVFWSASVAHTTHDLIRDRC